MKGSDITSLTIAYTPAREAILGNLSLLFSNDETISPACSVCALLRKALSFSVAYRVVIDDNYHYQDESERVALGQFETADEAIAVSKAIVDDFLAGAFEPGMSWETLWDTYKDFGSDPFARCAGRFQYLTSGQF